MNPSSSTFPVVVLFTLACSLNASDQRVEQQFNILFVVIDDLRPALGCYDDEVAKTPNIDRLAGKGIVFERAYCQQAVCSPSRLSVMTGFRPDAIQVWDLKTHFREAVPDVITLPQHFKNHGYHTQSIGKIYHGSGPPSKDPPSWSVDPQFDHVRNPKLRYALPVNLSGEGLKRSSSEAADVDDSHYVDGKVCNASLQALRALRATKFFLAVGLRKPHLPFCAPKKYWDMYDRARIPLPVLSEHPRDAPELATRSWKELEGYRDIPRVADGTASWLSEDKIRELRHGYYACVSYVDSLVGRLLNELEELELADKTIVVLWGDHGYHLGEQGLWTKANNFELATRVPLIVSVPGVRTHQTRTKALVELVDIYPTLGDLCGIPFPTANSRTMEGTSLRPLLNRPNQAWKRAAFSQFPRSWKSHRHQGNGDIMGYAVRTEGHRYVEWRGNESQQVIARELYELGTDPHETHNVANLRDRKTTVRRLSKLLAAGWRRALPTEKEGK